MCGICGIFNIDGKPVEMEVLRAMNDTLVHRGPDDEGYYLDGSVGLCHRRLSIIDLSTGKQPIYNEDKTKVVVFNGEIYNFQELRRELILAGHKFTTKTDTEVIIHGYEEWGEACVEKFRGMFAFAIWDGTRRAVFLARDRLGKKPLYYSLNNGTLAFASEIKALLKVDGTNNEIDLRAVSDYFSLGYVPAPKSIFRAVRKLPAGHTLIFSKEKFFVKQYWDVQFTGEEDASEESWTERLYEALLEAVGARLISDVPLGAFLSGGVDSSVIVGLMARLTPEPVSTNSVGFSVEKYSELEPARNTARHFKTRHYEYTVTPDAVDAIEKLSWFYDEPFADSSAVPTYYVSKVAREKVKVCLSGDAGDENFAGYRRYYYDRLENRLRAVLPRWFLGSFVRGLAAIYPKADWLPQPLRAKTLLSNLTRDPVQAYFHSMSFFSSAMKRELLSGDVAEVLNGYESSSVFRAYYDKCSSDDPLSRTQYVDFKTYLVDDILVKVDRASMANSLEVRVPLLDHKVVELAARIPSRLKLNGSVSKYIFKKMAGTLLPEEILERKKMGFTMPVAEWLRGALRPLVEDTILGERFAARGLFSTEYARRLWSQHQRGIRDHTQPLWALLMFEMWARRHLDR